MMIINVWNKELKITRKSRIEGHLKDLKNAKKNFLQVHIKEVKSDTGRTA